jgi:hypothetical protein
VSLKLVRLRVVSGLISSLIVFQLAMAGQSDSTLKIVVLDGNGSQNVVSQLAQRSVSVRVVDRRNVPVAGATVIFTVPNTGPGGSFLNGSNSIIVFTNQQGIAVAPQYRANSAAGPYQIQVRAAYMAEVGTAVIGQTNVATQKKSSSKTIMIVAAAGGAAAAAFVAKGKGGQTSSSSVTPPTTATVPTITLLGSSVGAPR